MNRAEFRSQFKPGDRIRFGVVWLSNDTPWRPVVLKGFFHSWDDSYRAPPYMAFVTLDQPCPQGDQRGKTFINVDCRELTLINALEQLAEES